MNRPLSLWVALVPLLYACGSNPDRYTIEQLRNVEPDVAEVRISEGLDKAMAGYRRFLAETPTNAATPEAMRRLADLQIEKEYGIIGGAELTDQAALPPPDDAEPLHAGNEYALRAHDQLDSSIADHAETEADFERRATGRLNLPSINRLSAVLPENTQSAEPVGPAQAIATYQRILSDYPYYERNDQVLYQMARAYDELGEPDKAMDVMQRLITEYGHSAYTDEVYFRRAEYFFVRKRYLDAEEAYSSVVAIGAQSDFFELALYKLGWSLFKQEFYKEALHQYVALLDHKVSTGYDFDQVPEVGGETVEEERRVADTFRVVSLAFSNLGGPDVLNEYFSSYGNRTYEDRIYSNLGEFYLAKLRYNDAATVYQSFTQLNPFHRIAPTFSMRVVEIYAEGGFAQLVVQAKKDFATRYGLNAEYWQHFDTADSAHVLSFLKTNLMDLANHYHSLYQDGGLEEERPRHYAEALLWYREFLTSFPSDTEAPAINYQLADLQFEEGDFREAATEYERTAYDYYTHEQAPAAGYAAIYAYRENLKVVEEPEATDARLATVDSSLRFADTFPTHEHAATVLAAAAQDLYEMQDFPRAIAAGTQLIEQHADADLPLRRAAWTVVAHASLDTALYAEAEQAYSQVLTLTPEDDESWQALTDNLAASIYKQGEQARELEDHGVAAGHFLRIKSVAPTSEIRPSAEYDGATALIALQDWAGAAAVFRDFRDIHIDHELQPEVTKQLAHVYRQAGELAKSAEEYERVADDTQDVELSREALLLAGELYEDTQDPRALAVYERYVEAFPSPVDLALETRFKIAGMYRTARDQSGYHDELRRIVAIDADTGDERTARTRHLAAKSALVLAEVRYDYFAELTLTQPFADSLAEKQARLDTAMSAFEDLVGYEVAEVTAAATFYMAEMYSDFGRALLDSERPANLPVSELADYELAIEAEAFPFEERAIEVHEKNLELMTAGTFNHWVQRSLDQLATLMPGRYAKTEISSGFIGPVEVFAYRSPVNDKMADVPEPPNGAADVSAAY